MNDLNIMIESCKWIGHLQTLQETQQRGYAWVYDEFRFHLAPNVWDHILLSFFCWEFCKQMALSSVSVPLQNIYCTFPIFSNCFFFWINERKKHMCIESNNTYRSKQLQAFVWCEEFRIHYYFWHIHHIIRNSNFFSHFLSQRRHFYQNANQFPNVSFLIQFLNKVNRHLRNAICSLLAVCAM